MAAPSGATDAVLKASDPVPEDAVPVVGLDFEKYREKDITAAEMVASMANMGFQASSIGQAAKIIDGMVGRLLQFALLKLTHTFRENGEIQKRAKEPPYS